jgi:hypothetical protein
MLLGPALMLAPTASVALPQAQQALPGNAARASEPARAARRGITNDDLPKADMEANSAVLTQAASAPAEPKTLKAETAPSIVEATTGPSHDELLELELEEDFLFQRIQANEARLATESDASKRAILKKMVKENKIRMYELRNEIRAFGKSARQK